MQKNLVISSTIVLGLLAGFSGCSSSDNRGSSKELPELESDGKAIVFYSASANTQYAYTVDDGSVLNLQGPTDSEGEDITNFNMEDGDEGKLFVWVDDKGDTNSSNDEEKIVMFDQAYSYAADGNATWENFYYLGHFHAHEEDGKTEYHLAAHSNDEFNVTSGAKFDALQRLNQYLEVQNRLEQNLTNTIPAEANGLCGFHTFVNEEGTTYYVAVGTNGTIYIYDENISTPFLDSVAITDSCSENEFGISSTEDGVLYFDNATQKVFAVDSHEDGIFHVHSSWGLDELIGVGKTAEMMVAIEPAE